MSDLISRSALLKEFSEKTPFGCGTIGIKFVDELIKAQPTAYDVKKVVAELEEAKGNSPETEEDWNYCGAIDEAIEIVKRGGIE